MAKQIEYRFRIALESQDLNTALVNFLKAKDPLFTERDKLFSALNAYWLPFAMKEAGYSDEELRQCAKNAIYRLKLHISYLAESFGLELDDDVVSQPVATTKAFPPVTKLPKLNDINLQPSTATEVISTGSQPLDDLIHHEDDSTFEGLFS
ncbi:hypothetical protein [Nostoc spongiaeforme]|uniref:hypothetical protein n=1 Tax=Nostoc spongiaeforme TaxID=502487 RepID=UPI001F55653F|nr:hypothetical protein [Nostoc spongiaeforme]